MDSGTDLDISRLSVSTAKYKDTTLRRQDREIERLTKTNFDLQLRLFHLEEKLISLDLSVDLGESENRFVNMLEDKQREVEEKENLLVKARQVIYALQDTVEDFKSAKDANAALSSDPVDGDSSLVFGRLISLEEELGEAKKLLGDAEHRVEALEKDMTLSSANDDDKADVIVSPVVRETVVGPSNGASGDAERMEVLEKMVEELKAELASGHEEYKELQEQAAERTARWEAGMMHVRQLEEDLKTEKAEKETLRGQSVVDQERAQMDIEKLMDEVAAVKLEVEAGSAKLEEACSKTEEAVAEAAKWKAAWEAKEQECLELREEGEVWGIEREAASSQIDALKREMEAEKERRRKLQAEKEEEEAEERTRRVEEDAKRVSAWKERVEELETALKEEKKKVVESEAHAELAEGLERALEEEKEKVDRLTEEGMRTVELKAKVEELKRELEEEGERRRGAEQQVLDSLTAADTLEEEVKELWPQLNCADGDVSFWRREANEGEMHALKWKELAEEMEKEVEAVRIDRDDEAELHRKVVDELQEEVRRLRARADEEAAAIFSHTTGLEDQTLMLKEQLIDARSEFSSVCQERAALHAQLDELTRELKTERVGFQEAQARDTKIMEEMKSSLESLHSQVKRLQGREAQLIEDLKKSQVETAAAQKCMALQDLTNRENVHVAQLHNVNGNDGEGDNGQPFKRRSEGSWQQIVLRQLETSKRLSSQLNRTVDIHRKVLLDGLAR